MRHTFRLILLVIYYSIINKIPEQLGGRKFRALMASRLFDFAGENINIQPNVHFGNGTKLRIGHHSGIGANSRLTLADTITIGNNVMIGPEVIIMTSGHHYLNSDKLMRLQGQYSRPVQVGDDVWIGGRAIIMPGIVIGNGAVIGAGAIVTKNVDSYTVVAGNPAKVIKKRVTHSAQQAEIKALLRE